MDVQALVVEPLLPVLLLEQPQELLAKVEKGMAGDLPGLQAGLVREVGPDRVSRILD